MSKCEGKQLHFNDKFETPEVNFWAGQKLVGLAAARSYVLSSPADVSRIIGAQLFAEMSPEIPGPSFMPRKAGQEICCRWAQPSCPSVTKELFLQKLGQLLQIHATRDAFSLSIYRIVALFKLRK